MKSFNRQGSTNHDWKLFEKIACDWKGPFRIKSYNNYRGVFIFSDYYSDFVYVFLGKGKNQLAEAVKVFNSTFLIPKKIRMKVFQADYENINISKHLREWLSKNSTTISLSTPYKHSQNGQVERDIQNVMDRARTLMVGSHALPGYWEFAVKAAAWYINRSPTSDPAHHGKTPYEIVNGRVPDLNLMVPFYCAGVYHVTKEERKNSWDPKARLCRMLGYDENSQGYIILDIKSMKVKVRNDCIFDPTIVERYVERFPDEKPITEQDEDDLDFESEEDLEEMELENQKSGDLNEEEEDFPEEESIPEDPDETESDPRHRALNHWINLIKEESAPYNDPYDSDDEIEVIYELEKRFENQPRFVAMTPTQYKSRAQVMNIINEVHSSMKGIKLPPAPKTLEQALNPANPDNREWWEAVVKECNVIDEYKSLVTASQTGHAMKSKWVLTLTLKNDYTMKYKVRLVVCGYSQIYGIDYKETFSPTTPILIVFLLLHIGASFNYTIANFDVTAAFLEGKTDYKQYARLPKEVEHLRVEVVGNLYGLKQAPKIWSDKLNEVLLKFNFQRCPVEPSLYMLEKGSKSSSNYKVMYVCIHVDDGLMIASDRSMIDKFMIDFQTEIKKATLFCPIGRYLGIDCTQKGNQILLSQQQYIDDDLDLELVSTKKPLRIPMPNTVNLRTELPNLANEHLLATTGKLRYLADRTRPDILTSLGEVSTGGSPHPSDMHRLIAKHITTFLKHTHTTSLTLGGNGPLLPFGYSDAAYITAGNSKSRLGGCIFLGLESGAIESWSLNDSLVSHSSMESEIRALDLLIRVMIHIRQLMMFMNLLPIDAEPTILYVDNESMITRSATLKSAPKTRHINMAINYIREQINERSISLVWIPTDKNVADLLTKPLAKDPFERHAAKLLSGHGGVIPMPVEIENSINHVFLDLLPSDLINSDDT
jgi:hypothetical protein